jgi:hypothetical protein
MISKKMDNFGVAQSKQFPRIMLDLPGAEVGSSDPIWELQSFILRTEMTMMVNDG